MRASEAIVVLTGAGISADSGVATFRGPQWLWEGRRVEDVATPEAWRRDPKGVWRFYQLRRAAMRGVAPNEGHRALAAFEKRCAEEGVPFLLVTQNVDDLHERAGSAPLHMHGELLKLRCEACEEVFENRDDVDPERFVACAACGRARLRPHVVWFGEIPIGLDAIFEALARCTRFLALGTSGVVYPAAGFLDAARRGGATTYVQSLDPPANLDPRDRFTPGRAAEAAPRLLSEIAADVFGA
jgi:NAD-dependent deacetylase